MNKIMREQFNNKIRPIMAKKKEKKTFIAIANVGQDDTA